MTRSILGLRPRRSRHRPPVERLSCERMFLEGLERRLLLSASQAKSITTLSWQGQTVKAVQDSWVVRMPATNTRGTATPLDDVYAAPAVPTGWSVRSLGYGFQQVTAPGVSLQNVSSWAKINKAVYVEPSVVRDRPAATFSTVRLASGGSASPLAGAPNDPSFNQQWALSNTGQNGGKAGADMSALAAWQITTGSPAAIVAVMDSGVDYLHPDLAPNMWTRPANVPASVVGLNGYDTGDGDDDPLDDSAEAGHGTHVAGIIGAKGNNGIGISGIAQTVSIIAMKIGDSSGAITGDLAAMTKLVELKQTYGVNIVAANASYGYYGPPMQQDRDAIALMSSAGILLVASAGNSNRNNDGGVRHYPSDYDLPNVIGVAATSNNDSRAYYSSYGRTSIDVGAPGGAMSSASDPRGILSTLPNNTYGFQEGTSMAAPYVTGMAALLKAAKPTATAAEIRTAILNGVDKNSALTQFVATGGRVNARKSLDLLLGNTAPAPTVSVANVSVTEGNSGTKSAQVTFTLSAAATSSTTIAYRTAAGTAAAGTDFITAASSLAIPAGATSGVVNVTIVGDMAVESDETFTVQVTTVNGNAVANVAGTVTIVNDDAAGGGPGAGPIVTIANVSMPEGNFGTPVMRFLVTLATAATRQTSVAFTTTNGTAIAGEDYLAAKGAVVFRAGETAKTVDVRLVGDTRVESDETLTVALSNPVGLTLGIATATGTIVNDDAATPAARPATVRVVGSLLPQRAAVAAMPAFLAVAPQAALVGPPVAAPATQTTAVIANPPPPDRLRTSPVAVLAIAVATPPTPQATPGKTAAGAPPSRVRLEAFATLADGRGLFGS
jgi:subtilisin family serine protease